MIIEKRNRKKINSKLRLNEKPKQSYKQTTRGENLIEEYLHLLKGFVHSRSGFVFKAVGKFKEEDDWDIIAYTSLRAMKSFHF